MIVKNKKIISDLSVIVVDHDNSFITYFMLLSLYKIINDINVYVILNKDNKYLELLYDLNKKNNKNIIFINNFNNRLLDIETKSPSHNHETIIKYLIKNHINTKYTCICDNDILFFSKGTNLFNNYMNYDVIGKYENILEEKVYIDSIINVYNTINNLNDTYINCKKIDPILYQINLTNNYFLMMSRFFPHFFIIKTEIFKKYLSDNDELIPGIFSETIYEDKKTAIYVETLSNITRKILIDNLDYKIKYIDIDQYLHHVGGCSWRDKKLSYDNYKKLYDQII